MKALGIDNISIPEATDIMKFVKTTLLLKGFIKEAGKINYYHLAPKVSDFVSFEDERRKENENQQVLIGSTTVIGNNNMVGNTLSSARDLNNNLSERTNTTSANNPINKSLLSKSAKIVIAILGAIASAIAIYEFIIKQFIIHK